MMKTKEINFTVTVDEQNMPVKIEWSATDADFEGKKPVQSMMIYLWDQKVKNTLHFGLWTKEMLKMDMRIHYFNTLMIMADTYERATGNKPAADAIRQAALQFDTSITMG